MTWIGLVNNEPAGGYPLGDLIYMCVSAGLGLLGAFIFVFFYHMGVYFLAGKFNCLLYRLSSNKLLCLVKALGGFYFAVYLLSWKEDLVITIVSNFHMFIYDQTRLIFDFIL